MTRRLRIELAPRSIELTAYDAELYIWTCSHNNKHDWRFPTILEITPSMRDHNHWKAEHVNGIISRRKHITIPVRNK